MKIVYRVVYVHPVQVASEGKYKLAIAAIAQSGKKINELQIFEMPGDKQKVEELHKQFSEGIKKDGYAILIH